MDLQLTGKVFIVTGGTGGLGRATAQVLLAEGARVLVTGRSARDAADVCAGLGAPADRVGYLQGDNSEPGLPGRLREAVLGRWGRLDGLFVGVGGPPPGRLLETGDAAWLGAFDSVFLGTVRLVRDLAPHIADGGAIALLLAISAKEASMALPISNGLRPGLAMLVKSFAEELGGRGIRVNALLPNLFATERMTALFDGNEPPTGHIALRRIGEPAEFGRMAAVLLSPVASYVTAAAISIDGGQLKSL